MKAAFKSLVLLSLAAVALGHNQLDFTVPPSHGNTTVKVHMFKAWVSAFPVTLFAAQDPNVPINPTSNLMGSAFMLEHPSGRRVMYDIGIRSDTQNLSPRILKTFTHPDGSFIKPEKDIPTQLKEGGIDLNSIDTVIWSHSHFDHIGDMTLFPNSTNVVVGPGTIADTHPTYPENPNANNVASDFAGHNFTEVFFGSPNIAGQATYDFFGDGSMYLIDFPGHVAGHMGALIRVTTSPNTYILLAGDSSHHVGLVRPSPGVRLPCDHQLDLPANLQLVGYPDFADPFLHPATQNRSIHTDAVTAAVTVGKVQRFDAREDIWVIGSHDGSLMPFLNKTDGVPLFPGTLNEWHKKGLKEMTKFAYLDADSPANLFKKNVTVATGGAASSSSKC